MKKEIFTITGLILGLIGLFLVGYHLEKYIEIANIVSKIAEIFMGISVDVDMIRLGVIGGIILIVVAFLVLAISPYIKEDVEEIKN